MGTNMKKVAVIASSIMVVTIMLPGLVYTPNLVNATFCIFNCDAQVLADKLQANLDCLRDQFNAGAYGRTQYGTEELSSDGKLIPSKVEPGKMLTEDELKQEWKDHQELYEHDCYWIADVTPQEVERVYQESLQAR